MVDVRPQQLETAVGTQPFPREQERIMGGPCLSPSVASAPAAAASACRRALFLVLSVCATRYWMGWDGVMPFGRMQGGHRRGDSGPPSRSHRTHPLLFAANPPVPGPLVLRLPHCTGGLMALAFHAQRTHLQVIDEADRLLGQGYAGWPDAIDRSLRGLPPALTAPPPPAVTPAASPLRAHIPPPRTSIDTLATAGVWSLRTGAPGFDDEADAVIGGRQDGGAGRWTGGQLENDDFVGWAFPPRSEPLERESRCDVSDGRLETAPTPCAVIGRCKLMRRGVTNLLHSGTFHGARGDERAQPR